MPIAHKFTSAITDGSDPTQVQPSNWNEPHKTVYDMVNVDSTLAAGDVAYCVTDDPTLVANGDPYFTYVKLLLPMEADFDDVTGQTKTLNGSPSIVTSSLGGFGSHAGSFGSGNNVQFSSYSGFNFAGSFTFEAWVQPSSSDIDGNFHAFFTQRVSAGVVFGLYNNRLFFWFNSGSAQISGSTALTAGNNYHVAFVRSGSTCMVFLNGVQDGTATYTGAAFDTGAAYIGGDGSGYGQHYYGLMKAARLTQGIARYTTGFTPPAYAHPTGQGSLTLTLPASPTTGDSVRFNMGPGPVWITLDGNGNNVLGASTRLLPNVQFAEKVAIFDGTEWKA